jgi:hypothetical protein
MELHLKVIGVILIILSLIHAVFPKYFNWKTELSSLSLINKQLIHIHTLFLALLLFLMGLLCITSSKELVETKLGNRLTLGLGVFWAIRLYVQFFGYSSKLWKGKKFETVVHVIFSMLWLYTSATFFYIYWYKR